MSKKIEIFTDGSACNGTHDKGGYGIVMINGTVKQFFGGAYFNTNSSRMEILGILKALEKCEVGQDITIRLDNEYCVHALEKGWIFKWSLNNWKNSQNKKVKNADLWKRFLTEYNRLERKVKLKWIRGHAKIEEQNYFNHVADILANMGANREIKIKDL